MTIIALIPARSGSKRLSHKNIRELRGHPLLSYTIQAAIDSGIFESIIVSTDSLEYSEIAEYYGALVPWLRPHQFSADLSPDIEWLTWTIARIGEIDKPPDNIAILRPTSPFRSAAAIRSAWEHYDAGHWMKMVQPVSQHPFKTWFVEGRDQMYIVDLKYNECRSSNRAHALPTQCLPSMYIQTGGLEIRPTSNLEPSVYQAFVVDDYQGFDINTQEDWWMAELLIDKGLAVLPEIHQPPYIRGQGRLWTNM